MEPTSANSPVTMNQIAQAAGVHISTVSLSLRDSPKIAPATRELVLRAARLLGYRHDPVHFALSARRAASRRPAPPPLIVFLTNRDSLEEFERCAHMPGFLHGAQEQARAMGFTCELQLLTPGPGTATALDESFAQRGVQGVILGAIVPPLPRVELDWSRYAVVKIDSWFMPPPITRISHDQQQALVSACRRLHALGYRRIGIAVGQLDEESSDNIYSSGYYLARHLLGLAVIPPLFFRQWQQPAENVRPLSRWVRQHRIEAVISNSTLIQSLLEDGGLPVPQTVACACLCLHEANPTLAGTVMNHHTVGRTAVETIALQIKFRQFGVIPHAPVLCVEGDWTDGASAPPKPGTPPG